MPLPAPFWAATSHDSMQDSGATATIGAKRMLKKYSSQSPSHKKAMTLRFAFACPAHMLATFFGTGVLRPASGTWGSLAALLCYMSLESFVPAWCWCCLIALCFVLGARSSQSTGQDIGVHDHSSIVIDEVFAVWLTLLAVPSSWPWQVAAFAVFRFFDIVKIFPARWFDESPRWRNGWGVMLDDAVAAVQSILLLRLLVFIA